MTCSWSGAGRGRPRHLERRWTRPYSFPANGMNDSARAGKHGNFPASSAGACSPLEAGQPSCSCGACTAEGCTYAASGHLSGFCRRCQRIEHGVTLHSPSPKALYDDPYKGFRLRTRGEGLRRNDRSILQPKASPALYCSRVDCNQPTLPSSFLCNIFWSSYNTTCSEVTRRMPCSFRPLFTMSTAELQYGIGLLSYDRVIMISCKMAICLSEIDHIA